MIYQVIRTGTFIDVFNVLVLKHFRESFRDVHFDVGCRFVLQGQQYRSSVLRLLALSVRHRVPSPLF